MGNISTPEPCVLFLGAIALDWEPVQDAVSRLGDGCGEVAGRWGPMDFSPFTDYYHEEMGEPLFRWFLSFQGLKDPGILARIKTRTNQVETELSANGARRVNLDPGLLDRSKVVLASTKDHAHRIYIGQGIYAEVTLGFAHGAWHPMPWTYPDYRTEEYLAVFEEMRKDYLEARRISLPSE